MLQIEQLLRETMGLDAASIGTSSIQRTVRLRMKLLGLKDENAYYEMLATSRAEWRELVESVVVTETWFFRDRELFGALVGLVAEEWLPAHPTRPLRMLCVPCSSGEEAFSVLMALSDAGVPTDRIQVDASDLSARALARAQRGIYRKNSFRGPDLAFRERYFHASKEGFVLEPSIHKRVNFFEGNLLSDDFLAGKGNYDFIFCRNLLIYFDRATQKKALDKLQSLLTRSGVLFVGPAEQPLVLDHGFVSANIPMAFACRRRGYATARREPRGRSPRPSKPHLFADPAGETSPPQPQFVCEPGPPAQAKPTEFISTDLEDARRLADVGQLKEAAEICEAHLRMVGASAQAYYLLGLVRDASNDTTAADCYRKALYLEPNHYESLLQMALLAQKNGDAARARTFRNRAERIKSGVTNS